MSVAHTTTTPAPAAPLRRSSLLRWIGGGTLAATVLTAATLAVWPASATDQARADGERFGEAVASLSVAQSGEDVDAALTDIQVAAGSVREHAGDQLADQVGDQKDALDRAADGFVGAHTSDGFEADLYQSELDTAVGDLKSQADDFRTEGPEVQQVFWDGFDTGLNG
jgi:hypothetical protein